ncbi:MAG: STAS domain-containing protein [Patescibacteria group bacterium]
MAFKMEVSTASIFPVISLEGEVDIYTSPQLKQQIMDTMKEDGVNLIVDLNKVDYLDTTGLGVMLSSLRRIREQDGNLALACSSPRILNVFNYTDLNKTFDIYATVEEAVASISDLIDPLPPAA